MEEQLTIGIIGSGYVGLVAAVCFAELGHYVICVDSDESKVALLRQGNAPIHEEYLPQLLERHQNGLIEFTTDLKEATQRAQVLFIAVGTPQGNAGTADLSYVDAVASEIARAITGYRLIVEKSTVPVYTSEWIRRIMVRNGVSRELFDVASNPEFLREGTAVADFLHPDRIVIGVDSERAAVLLRKVYAPLTTGSYYRKTSAIPGARTPDHVPPLFETSTKAAEIIKHASNAFLAMKISFINVVSNICEAVGADIEQVSQGIGSDRRIGNSFLKAGIGYGGSCFPKDVAAFRYVAEHLGVEFGLLHEVEKVNREQKKRFFRKVRSALWTFRGKKLGVLGLAFKGGTDDIRESPAIDLVRMFLEEGCMISAYDPAAMERASYVLPSSTHMMYAEDAYEAARDADALLVLTDWQEFIDLDFDRLSRIMRYPVVIDGRNLLDPSVMRRYGFTYLGVGRAAAPQEKEATFFYNLP